MLAQSRAPGAQGRPPACAACPHSRAWSPARWLCGPGSPRSALRDPVSTLHRCGPCGPRLSPGSCLRGVPSPRLPHWERQVVWCGREGQWLRGRPQECPGRKGIVGTGGHHQGSRSHSPGQRQLLAVATSKAELWFHPGPRSFGASDGGPRPLQWAEPRVWISPAGLGLVPRVTPGEVVPPSPVALPVWGRELTGPLRHGHLRVCGEPC